MFSLSIGRRRRKLLPKSANDFIACLFLTLCIPVVFFYNVFIIIPYSSTRVFYNSLHLIVAIYLLSNVIGNFICLLLVDTSILTTMSTKSAKQGWRLCSVCEANVPPRSFHCPSCRICILKRDHHCVFSGCCIGFHNHRYYIALLTHLWLGMFYSIVLIFCSGYIWQWFRITDIASLVLHICPVLFWMTGNLDTKLFCNLLVTALICFGFLFVTTLLCYHCNLILNGQTTHEKNYRILKYKSKTWTQNVVNVMGRKWILAFLWFGAESQVIGDGVSFVTL